VRALSKLLRDNFGFVVQGIGVVVPIFATYDFAGDGQARLYFYDAMGAQFEVDRICGHRFGFTCGARRPCFTKTSGAKTPLHKLREEDAVTVALRALDTAAEADTATGGVDRNARIFR
jgi:proteasome beta subunit